MALDDYTKIDIYDIGFDPKELDIK